MFPESNPYFSVPHAFDVYLSLWPKDAPLPTESQLLAMQSTGLKLMSEVKALEAGCLLQLRQLGDEGRAIVDYLKLQSRKIDLVLQHVLEQESREGQHCPGVQFGGSGVRVQLPQALDAGTFCKLTLFIRDEILSLQCIASVRECRADPGHEASFWPISTIG